MLFLLAIFLLYHGSESFNVTFEPITFEPLRAEESRSVLLRISVDPNENRFDQNLSIGCLDDFVCEIEADPQEILVEKKNLSTPTIERLFNVTILGKFVGVTQLNFTFGESSKVDYKLRILRSSWDHTKAKLFVLSLVIFIPCITFLMGTQLEWKKILSIWKKPIGPCTGMLCQFGIMPLVAYCMAKYVLAEENISIRLALFAAGTCPGGGKSSFWTIIWGGNLDLSISMTFSQHIAALLLMPVWIGTLGKEFSTEEVHIPYMDIIKGLVALMIPTVAGMIFINFKRHLYEKIQKWIKRIVWVATFFFMAIMIYSNFYIFFILNWRMVLCACFLPWSGYIIALLVATAFRMDYADKITIALETGIQHISIAVVIMIWSLPEPEVDLAVAILLVGMLMTDKPLVLLFGIVKFYQRCIKKEKNDKIAPVEEEKKAPPPQLEAEKSHPQA